MTARTGVLLLRVAEAARRDPPRFRISTYPRLSRVLAAIAHAQPIARRHGSRPIALLLERITGMPLTAETAFSVVIATHEKRAQAAVARFDAIGSRVDGASESSR